MIKAISIPLVLTMAGCANVMQTATISEAYESYEEMEYAETLSLIRRAQYINTTTPEHRAEMTYLEAQTYEQLGEVDKARTLYEYLKNQRRDSQFGYLAGKRLQQGI